MPWRLGQEKQQDEQYEIMAKILPLVIIIVETTTPKTLHIPSACLLALGTKEPVADTKYIIFSFHFFKKKNVCFIYLFIYYYYYFGLVCLNSGCRFGLATADLSCSLK